MADLNKGTDFPVFESKFRESQRKINKRAFARQAGQQSLSNPGIDIGTTDTGNAFLTNRGFLSESFEELTSDFASNEPIPDDETFTNIANQFRRRRENLLRRQKQPGQRSLSLSSRNILR